MARSAARPPLTSFGISMLGPALLKFGNEEQKKHYLTADRPRRNPLVPGLFGAGRGQRPRRPADQGRRQGRPLAGQRPEGVDQLCRPGRLDLLPGPHFDRVQAWRDQLPAVRHGEPGVSTKPILLISGNSPFCETFFDDVKVPKDQLVGEVNKGWDVAKYLLGHEREMISGMGLGGGSAPALGRDARPVAEARRSAAARRDRRVRRRRPRLRGDERALHRPVEGRRSASRHAVDDEICRDRAQQAPPRTDHGGGRQRRAGMGQRAVEGRQAAARLASHQGQFDRGRHQRNPAQHRRQAHPSACREPDAWRC